MNSVAEKIREILKAESENTNENSQHLHFANRECVMNLSGKNTIADSPLPPSPIYIKLQREKVRCLFSQYLPAKFYMVRDRKFREWIAIRFFRDSQPPIQVE